MRFWSCLKYVHLSVHVRFFNTCECAALFVYVRALVHKLTSSVPVADVREPPNVPKIHRETDDGK